jgi:tetratricopeptide (TPR) repeat protein
MRGGWLAGLGAVAALFLVLTVARGTAWRDSVALWESSIAQDPANPDALNNLGIAYARERRYAEAEEALRRSLSLRPKSGSARNNLANVLILTGRHEEALRELEKAGNLEKDLVYAAQAHHTRGIAHEAMGDPARALEAYERALRLNPVYLDDAPLRARIRRCRAALSPAPRE